MNIKFYLSIDKYSLMRKLMKIHMLRNISNLYKLVFLIKITIQRSNCKGNIVC